MVSLIHIMMIELGGNITDLTMAQCIKWCPYVTFIAKRNSIKLNSRLTHTVHQQNLTGVAGQTWKSCGLSLLGNKHPNTMLAN